jgi:small-conductance mechanosensitive channel/CRP-like cAMP-binding protein
MNSSSLPTGAAYVEVLLGLAALAVALLVFFLWRGLLMRFRASGAQSVVSFLVKISLPAILLIAALALKLSFWRRALGLGPRFSQVVDAALIFLVVMLVVRLIDAGLLYSFERRRRPFPVPGVLRGFFLAVVYIAVLFVVLKGILGINISPFLATSAIFTAIIGLALQGTLSNVVAGISLHLTKSFSRGDWVSIGAHEGVVVDTNWRETLVLDRASNIVVIPNSAAASEMIVNFARPDQKTALNIPLKVSYGAPVTEVVDILKSAAREVPEVLSTPAPQAYVLSYDELGVSYLVKFWVTDYARKFTTRGEVARHIWYKFKRHNIEIPVALSETVKQAVHALKEEEKLRVEEESGERNFRDLYHSRLFRAAEGDKAGELVVAPDDVRLLAGTVKRRTYTKGEVVFRQGEKGESCHIVASGLVRGEIIYEEKEKKYTSEFRTGPGGLFGEMSLFTGLPRTATCVVEEDAELLEIRAEDFARLLAQNPGVAEAVADLVSERNRKNAEFLGKIKELSAKDVEDCGNRGWILARLRKLGSLFRRSE